MEVLWALQLPEYTNIDDTTQLIKRIVEKPDRRLMVQVRVWGFGGFFLPVSEISVIADSISFIGMSYFSYYYSYFFGFWWVSGFGVNF
jgi:hypothetical protein